MKMKGPYQLKSKISIHLEYESSLLQTNSNNSLHENVRTVSARIKDFTGPGIGKFTVANEVK